MIKLIKGKMKYQFILWILIIAQLLMLFAVSRFRVDDMAINQGNIYSYNTGWTLYKKGSTVEKKIELPYTMQSEAGEILIMERCLPDSFKGLTIFTLSGDKSFRVVMDNKEIYSFGMYDQKKFGHTPGSVANFIELPHEWESGVIRFEMTSEYADYAGNISQIMVGEKSTLIVWLIRKNLFYLLLCILILFCGFFLIILNIIQRLSKRKTTGTFHLGFLCIIGSVYYSIETRVLSIFYGNQTMYSFIIFLSMMSIPTFLQLYYLTNLKPQYHIRLRTLLILSYTNITVQLVLQYLDVCEFMTMSPASHILIAATCIVIVESLISTLIKYPDYYNGRKDFISLGEIIAISSVFVGSIADIVHFYLVRTGDAGIFTRYGLTIFGLLMILVHINLTVRDYIKDSVERAKMSQMQMEIVEKNNKELTEANQIAERAKMDAELANRAKSDFLANMSHEIRTPINAVLGMDEMILREAKDENVLAYAKDIKMAGQTLLSLVNDVLDISKIESDKMEIIPVEYQVRKLVQDCYNMVSGRAQSKNLKFKVKVDEQIPAGLYGDEVRIREIILNLLTNAIKYTHEGQIRLNIGYEDISRSKIQLCIHVADTGIGIAPQDQEILFDSFVRLDLRENRNIEGTGLGLSITKKIVDLMGGEISVESNYGVGSVFHVKIPQKIVDAKPIGKSLVVENGKDNKKNKKNIVLPAARILCVDDIEMNLKVFAGLLKNTKVQVDLALSGEKCLEMIQKQKYDMIFMDHMMPGIDGIQTLKEIRKRTDHPNEDTPVIVLTANAVVGAREEYLTEGFADYLSKPINPQILSEIILKYYHEEETGIVE